LFYKKENKLGIESACPMQANVLHVILETPIWLIENCSYYQSIIKFRENVITIKLPAQYACTELK